MRLFLLVLALTLTAPAPAGDHGEFVLSERALEGAVQTRIGELHFENGYPSDETIDRLYDEMDFQRAVQAYIWGLPMV